MHAATLTIRAREALSFVQKEEHLKTANSLFCPCGGKREKMII